MIEIDKSNEIMEAVSTAFRNYIDKGTDKKAMTSAMQYYFNSNRSDKYSIARA